ncbi:MAG: hypothetical protein L6R39_005552 [Caloplaca ligustica]|nr:MAG: hypothetical protein L6R39_005552 [Caloplaca ligustica]
MGIVLNGLFRDSTSNPQANGGKPRESTCSTLTAEVAGPWQAITKYFSAAQTLIPMRSSETIASGALGRLNKSHFQLAALNVRYASVEAVESIHGYMPCVHDFISEGGDSDTDHKDRDKATTCNNVNEGGLFRWVRHQLKSLRGLDHNPLIPTVRLNQIQAVMVKCSGQLLQTRFDHLRTKIATLAYPVHPIQTQDCHNYETGQKKSPRSNAKGDAGQDIAATHRFVSDCMDRARRREGEGLEPTKKGR